MESTFNERENTTQTFKRFVAQKIPNLDHHKLVAKLNLAAVDTYRLEERISKMSPTSAVHIYNAYNKKVAEIMARIIDEIAFDIACDRMHHELHNFALLDIDKQLFVEKYTNSNSFIFFYKYLPYFSDCYCQTFWSHSKLHRWTSFE